MKRWPMSNLVEWRVVMYIRFWRTADLRHLFHRLRKSHLAHTHARTHAHIQASNAHGVLLKEVAVLWRCILITASPYTSNTQHTYMVILLVVLWPTIATVNSSAPPSSAVDTVPFSSVCFSLSTHLSTCFAFILPWFVWMIEGKWDHNRCDCAGQNQ